MAERIRLSRAKGARLPATARNVARPTKWGNPFTIASCIENGFAETKEDAQRLCAEVFRSWLNGNTTWHYRDGEERRQSILADVHTLRGYDLACWCGPGPCHADELLRRANADA